MISFKDSRALRADARESLLGHLTTTVTALLLYMFSTSVLVEMVNGLDSGSVLLSLALSVMVFFVVNTCGYMLRIGLAYIFMRLAFRQGARLGDLFCAFRKNSNTAVTLSGFMALLELFCMLPLIFSLSVLSAQGRSAYSVLLAVLFAAGFAAAFYVRLRYAMLAYLHLDFPDLTPRQLIRGSAKLIRGHKMRLFKLYLSFLPLQLLTVLSLGIAGLWVSSYTQAATAAFYKDLMANRAF